jgi:hypothetical protein
MSSIIRSLRPIRAGAIFEIRAGLFYVRLDGAADSRVVFHPAAWRDGSEPAIGDRVILHGSPVEYAYREVQQ